MPEDMQQPITDTQKRSSDGSWLKSATGLAVMAIIFGFLIPPIGLVLALAALYKSGKQSNKLAMVLSVVGVLAIIAGSSVYVWLYNDHQNSSTATTKPYQYSSYEDYKLAGVAKGRGETFKKPSNFDPSIYGNNGSTQTSLIQKVKLPSYSNLVTVGSIDSTIALSVQKIDAAYLQKVNKAFTGQGSDYDTYKNEMTNYLRVYVYTVQSDTLTLSSPKSFTSDNIKANAWLTDYAVKTTYDDGTIRDISGQLLYAIGAKDVYYFSISSLSENFKANTSTWKTVFDSLKIDQ